MFGVDQVSVMSYSQMRVASCAQAALLAVVQSFFAMAGRALPGRSVEHFGNGSIEVAWLYFWNHLCQW